ncbi:hypothetical protein BCR32DRAFT_199337 [Anaeromyces robustus]|uniref:alpha-galactosidase n=1 Tax=Anaeromyces robustus TaxID=1754192 RepID=A0A1Y1XLC1_9FUNG|nr:hypothetical protein BCR32DRAFT_199337 [Anaeromyces robustus]|eukprot:ORX86134.1 hypothetical protein BCR32DRAFT_199337 [Anaeromyces robustus]
MNLSFITSILVSLLFVDNIEARWKPTQGMTWNYVLGHSVDIKIEKAQVLDVDVNKSVGTIEEYHKAGKKVICYFSGGTLENFRDDKDDFYAVKGLVRNTYEAWADEKWLDIRKADLKPLIKRRMETAVKKNCDAIEVDNLDAYQFDEVKSWDDPLTKKDLINYAIWLGKTAHELGISIGLKNALFMIDEVSNYFDFAINESCAALSHPECHLYKNFLKQGKAVFGITYNGFSRYQSALCKELNGLGISMIVKETGALEQAGTIFDGKKHCKNFDPGKNT